MRHESSRRLSAISSTSALMSSAQRRSITRTRCWSFRSPGERFEGVATFTEWRRLYPADLDKVRYKLRRVTVRTDLAVVELTASYDGESWLQGLQLLEFRGDKVARERIYVMEAWEAPKWRAPWRSETPADPHVDINTGPND
jgi:hypothetical protein